MVESNEQTAAPPVPTAAGEQEDEQYFINEEQFENVVPEFGTCGTDANPDTADEGATQAGKDCPKQDCCKNTAQETSNNTAKAEEVKVADRPKVRNPCYKCKEK